MKLKVLLFLICSTFYSQAKQPKDVFISGKLINLNNRTNIIDLSEIGALRPPNNDREIAPDSAGNFYIHFKLKEPNYFRIGRNVLYLSPGDRLKAKIDYDWPEKSIFSGSGSVENRYLSSTPFSKSGSYLEGGLNLKTTLRECIDFILRLAQQRREKLIALHNIQPDFFNLERARIDADVINSFKLLPGIFTRQNKISGDNQTKVFKAADSLTRPYVIKYSSNLHNSSFLKIEVVRDNFYAIMDDLSGDSPDIQRIKDWQYAYELVYYINASKDKADLLKLKVKIDSIKNANYRGAATESFDMKAGFWNGDTAINFQAYDVDGHATSLSSFKGKIIYIDLWATWCVPCLKEMPFLDSLKKKYRNDPNIVFISLCMNEKTTDWQKNLQIRRPDGIQLIANRSQMTLYKIYSIPRAIIIDKSFKVLMMNAPTPSNPGLPGYLESLLKSDR